jgi:hypothetical protein
MSAFLLGIGFRADMGDAENKGDTVSPLEAVIARAKARFRSAISEIRQQWAGIGPQIRVTRCHPWKAGLA